MTRQSDSQLQEIQSVNLHRTKQNPGEEVTDAMNPSTDAYGALIYAFDYFNQRLFHGILQHCIITMPWGRKRFRGFFCGKSWSKVNQAETCDEIAINPLYFQGSSTEQVLSTLVHEMVHLQQHQFGKPGKGAYHNKEWGRLMRQVGLIPSSTARPGGDEIGRAVSHYIEEDGVFQRVCQELLGSGFVIPWHMITASGANDDDEDNDHEGSDDDHNTARKKRASKTKYSCPECRLNAWAKPDTPLLCGRCRHELIPNAS